MPANIELKARLRSRADAEAVAAQLGPFVGELAQRDTYFQIPPERGRLKLREINDCEAELIAYMRPDHSSTRRSDYQRVPLTPEAAAGLKAALTAALSVRQVVTKVRRLYLAGDVRIHLDQVEGVGSCLEFEAVLEQPGERLDEPTAHRRLAELAERFGIRDEDRLAVSYAELLAESRSA